MSLDASLTRPIARSPRDDASLAGRGDAAGAAKLGRLFQRYVVKPAHSSPAGTFWSLDRASRLVLARSLDLSTGYLESLPLSVRTRLNYLENLQEDYDAAEGALDEEIKALEKKYKPVFDKLTNLRKQVVSGNTEAPEEFKAEADAEGDESTETGEDVSGIPDFWLVALCNCELIEEMISQKDAEILAHLIDVRCEDILDDEGDEEGYKLTFEFAKNEYFGNKELTLRIDASTENGLMNVDALEGTKINWSSDAKNPTIKIMKKKQKPGGSKKPAIKREPVDSFFNLFTPPDLDIGDLDDKEAEEVQELIERTLAIGEFLREDLVPHAVRWFTGEAIEEDEDDDDSEEGNDSDEDSADDDDDDEDEDDYDEDDYDEDESDDDGPAKVPVDAENPECKQQ